MTSYSGSEKVEPWKPYYFVKEKEVVYTGTLNLNWLYRNKSEQTIDPSMLKYPPKK